MFNNYQELFDGYLNFYRKTLAADGIDSTPSAVAQSSRCPSLFHEIVYGHHRGDPLNATSHHEHNETSMVGQPQQSSVMQLGSRLLDRNGRLITIGSFNRPEPADWAAILLVLANLVLAKRWLSRRLRRSTWLAERRLRQRDRERLDECLWRLLFYSFSSLWLTYTCFMKHQAQLLFEPSGLVVFGHSEGHHHHYPVDLDWDEHLILIIECAFYLHATYALIFEDVWRRDSPMMLVHHLAAIFSLLAIYATR